MWANIVQGIYLSNIGPWLTNNIPYQNKLYKVVSTKLGQHRIGISDNIAQENYLCNIGPERTPMVLQENNLRKFVLGCLGQHGTKQLPVQCINSHQRCSVKKVLLKIS